jgi:hypothetical protein
MMMMMMMMMMMSMMVVVVAAAGVVVVVVVVVEEQIVDRMIGKGSRNTRRKPAPVPICPPHIDHYFTRSRNLSAAVVACLLAA